MTAVAPNALTGASLATLRRDAATAPQDETTLRKVAQQFEALLTQQVLKSSRANALGADLMGGAGLDLYKDLFDQQMAQQISSGQGLGLAEVLVQQLRGSRLPGALAGVTQSLSPLPERPTRDAVQKLAAVTEASTVKPASVSAPPSDRITHFIQKIWHHAEQAAKALGLPTEAVVGHAALETGWGAHQPGGTSHNLFGIKTGSRWQGERVTASTTEMDGGRSRREQAEFRSYESTEQGFADYVRFLKANPRYAEAIQAGNTPQQFAQGLQKAGYATDPQYASKLQGAIAKAAAMKPASAAQASKPAI